MIFFLIDKQWVENVWFNISDNLTIDIINKKKTKYTISKRVKEMMNYFLLQKLMIKPTTTKSLTSRKVHISALSLGTVSLTETII